MTGSITWQEHCLSYCPVKDVSTHTSVTETKSWGAQRDWHLRGRMDLLTVYLLFSSLITLTEANSTLSPRMTFTDQGMKCLAFFFSFETWRSFHSAWMTLKEVKENVEVFFPFESYPPKVASLHTEQTVNAALCDLSPKCSSDNTISRLAA